MKIKKVQLKNGYKRFLDLTIDLGDDPKKIIALVGPNGCGKSSVLDGLLFHSNAYYGNIGNKGGKDHSYHSMNQSPGFQHTNVIIELTDSDFGAVLNRKSTTGNQKTMFSFRSPYRYNTNLKVTNSQAMPEIKLNGYGASTSSDLDDKMDENYRRLNIKYNKYLNDADIKPSEAKLKIIGDLNKSISNCLDLRKL
jgi:DNA repair exonuclease SbcCD ATPase subunit